MRQLMPLLVALAIVGCTAELPANRICFDEIRYVRSFPERLDLGTMTPDKTPNLDATGILELHICDTLLVAATRNKTGFWTFFSLPGLQPLGCCLRNGNGPGEFPLLPPSASLATWCREADGAHAYLYDMLRRQLFDLQVDATLRTGTTTIRRIDGPLPAAMAGAAYVGQGRWLLFSFEETRTKVVRSILADGQLERPAFLEPLNAGRGSENDDTFRPLILPTAVYSPRHDRVLEMFASCNYFNLYAPDGSFARTVCLGDRLSDLDRLLEQDRDDIPTAFLRPMAYDACWAVLACEKQTEADPAGISFHLYLFDWEGRPLGDIRIGERPDGLMLDLARGHLYVLDPAGTEALLRYDIAEWLGKALG